jgi:hypothetical protein
MIEHNANIGIMKPFYNELLYVNRIITERILVSARMAKKTSHYVFHSARNDFSKDQNNQEGT